MKIWAKVMKSDKILRDTVYDSDLAMSQDNFTAALQEIAYRLDTATPVQVASQFRHFLRFNRVKYLSRDFIEDIDFTSLVLELILDK